MKIIIAVLIIFITVNVQSQTGTFTDSRDRNVYQTISIGDKVWFRENLRLKTSLSYFPNFSKDTADLIYGNYYSYTELNTLCPEDWHVATINDLTQYIRLLITKHALPDSAIIVNTSADKDSSLFIKLGNINPLVHTMLNLVSIGWVEGNKLQRKKSLTFWLRDTRTNDDKFHTHIGPHGYIIHTHYHNVIDKPKRIRKFAIRCVCENK